MQAARGASLTSAGGHDTAPARDDRAAPRQRRLRLFGAVVTAAYAADVITKIVAVEMLSGRPDVEVIPGVLDLHLTRNPGAAFSMATGFTWLLTLVAAVVAVVVARTATRLRDRTWAVALGLLLGGALGNLTDRLLREPGPLRGHVVDFLRLPHWPVFNLADVAIVVAAGLILLQSVRGVGVDGRG
jgi:signal peptidase II